MWQRLVRGLFVVGALCGLVGCQDVLFAKLSEAQANEVLAALAEARIGASKERVDEQNWRVQVGSDRMGEALVYLRDRGLPVRPSPTMGEVFKKDGMISTPTEERARYAWALQEGIAATLRRIDGVTEARVHVALPHNDPLSDKPVPSSASVFIKHRQTLDVDVLSPQIKSMVMSSVEGLDYRNISLFAYPVDARPLMQGARQNAALGLPLANAAAADLGGGAEPASGAAWWWALLALPLSAALAAVVWRRRDRRPAVPRLVAAVPTRAAADGAPGGAAARHATALPQGLFGGAPVASPGQAVVAGQVSSSVAATTKPAQPLGILPRGGAASLAVKPR